MRVATAAGKAASPAPRSYAAGTPGQGLVQPTPQLQLQQPSARTAMPASLLRGAVGVGVENVESLAHAADARGIESRLRRCCAC